MGEPYDLAIIGADSAGLTAASFARGRDAHVTLVDKQEV